MKFKSDEIFEKEEKCKAKEEEKISYLQTVEHEDTLFKRIINRIVGFFKIK